MKSMYLLAAGAVFSLASLPVAACSDLLSAKFRTLAGKDSSSLCEQFEGQVLLVVNTASKCGFTPQYEGLEALHQRLKGRGFAVIGFPSNDFMGQEPGTEQEIQEFCTLTYGVKFPMFEKLNVKGEAAHPFYRALTEATGQEPGWNFHKYLIDRSGKAVASFGSRVKPDDAEMLRQIDELLEANADAGA